MKKIIASGTFFAALFVSSAALANCQTDVKKDDITAEQATVLYDCIKEKMREGYASKEAPFAKEYQGWKSTASAPAAPGPHGKRFLVTYVNDTGHAEYVKFSEERSGNPMPVGSILAKESFNISKKKGNVKVGPLFFMQKVAKGTADEFGNWVYSAVQPKGKVMKIKQGFCHGCHAAFEDQDSMGYPVEEVRLK